MQRSRSAAPPVPTSTPRAPRYRRGWSPCPGLCGLPMRLCKAASCATGSGPSRTGATTAESGKASENTPPYPLFPAMTGLTQWHFAAAVSCARAAPRIASFSRWAKAAAGERSACATCARSEKSNMGVSQPLSRWPRPVRAKASSQLENLANMICQTWPRRRSYWAGRRSWLAF